MAARRLSNWAGGVAESVPTLRPALHRLTRRDRRRLVIRATVHTTVTTVLLFVLYAVAPVPFVPGADAFFRLIAVVVIVVTVIALQIRSILSAHYPALQAIQSLVTAIAVFIVLFALLYFGLATVDPTNFNRPLTRVSALYFTVTVLTTVGFGDITAQSDVAQLSVTVQMLLGLTLIALTVRVFTAAARAGVTRRTEQDNADSTDGP